jgi:ABC-type glycerol-3-phosphate transport system substrate-binding protein
LLALCALLALPAACPAEDLSEMGPRSNLQVTLWETDVPAQKHALQELVFSFQQANPDVIVCLEWKDAELQDDWTRRWCGGMREYAPDVTVLSGRGAWENRHELLEMPDEFGRELRRDFHRAVMRRLPGQARGVPWEVSTYALYYRPDLLTEADAEVPQTLQEVVTVAEALADPPARFGLGLPQPLSGGEELLHALAVAAGEAAPEDEITAEDEPQADEEGEAEEAAPDRRRRGEADHAGALELLVELQSRGALQPETLTWSQPELIDLFVEGRLGMLIAPISAARALRAAEEPPEWAVAPLPIEPEGAGYLSVQWMVAFADTDRPENAIGLLRYMAEVESQRMLAMMPGVPGTRELADELSGQSPWSAHIAALTGDAGAEGVPLSRWERLKPQLGEALVYALSGRLTPREALTRAVGE